jgi:hypothetical protein
MGAYSLWSTAMGVKRLRIIEIAMRRCNTLTSQWKALAQRATVW